MRTSKSSKSPRSGNPSEKGQGRPPTEKELRALVDTLKAAVSRSPSQKNQLKKSCPQLDYIAEYRQLNKGMRQFARKGEIWAVDLVLEEAYSLCSFIETMFKKNKGKAFYPQAAAAIRANVRHEEILPVLYSPQATLNNRIPKLLKAADVAGKIPHVHQSARWVPNQMHSLAKGILQHLTMILSALRDPDNHEDTARRLVGCKNRMAWKAILILSQFDFDLGDPQRLEPYWGELWTDVICKLVIRRDSVVPLIRTKRVANVWWSGVTWGQVEAARIA